jgi:hypothetical protein
MAKDQTKPTNQVLCQVLGAPERPALPGQDPGRVEAILELLTQELQPTGMIEQLWLADIAYLTARIEYFRAGLRGFYAGLQRAEIAPRYIDEMLIPFSPAYDRSGHDAAERRREELRALQVNDFQPEPGKTHLDDSRFTHMLGQIIGENLAIIQRLDDTEQRLLRERDRMIAQFDRRRRNAVRDAVENAEAKPPALPAPSPG